jgi:hypothetical protein
METPISATVSRAASLPLRYQWTQMSGPAVVISTPTAANTTVRLASSVPPGIGRAVLQLTVTDAIGRSSSSEVELQTANLAGLNNVLYYSTTSGSVPDYYRTIAVSNVTGVFASETRLVGELSLGYDDNGSSYTWKASVADQNGGIPAVGSYAGAKSFPESGSNLPLLRMYFNSMSCTLQSGSFKVLEIEYDGSGPVKKLALDFDQTCIGSVPTTTHGSIRINSAVPVAL